VEPEEAEAAMARRLLVEMVKAAARKADKVDAEAQRKPKARRSK
jgi:hypothetical protein